MKLLNKIGKSIGIYTTIDIISHKLPTTEVGIREKAEYKYKNYYVFFVLVYNKYIGKTIVKTYIETKKDESKPKTSRKTNNRKSTKTT